MTDTIIAKIIPYPTLKVDKTKHQLYEQQHKIAKPIHIEMPGTLLGIEVEVENITGMVPISHYWKSKEDGSLRNYGMEFVSIPLRGYQVEYALDHLNTVMSGYNTPDFSPRTSIHIHMNVRDMTWNQIRTLVLLYAIFERHFFHIAGTKRETSVFCVPLYKTESLIKLYELEHGITWHKYAAINLGTIMGNNDVSKFGTVEFRHLYGTMDKNIIINWINNILCLRKAVVKMKYEDLTNKIKELNTSSEYYALYKQIFGDYALTDLMTKKDFEHCVTTTKKALWGSEYNYLLYYKAESAYYTHKQNKQATEQALFLAQIKETKAKITPKKLDKTVTGVVDTLQYFNNWFNLPDNENNAVTIPYNLPPTVKMTGAA